MADSTFGEGCLAGLFEDMPNLDFTLGEDGISCDGVRLWYVV